MNTVLKWTLQKYNRVTMSVQKLTPSPGPDATLLWVHGCKPALVAHSNRAVSVMWNLLHGVWAPTDGMLRAGLCLLAPATQQRGGQSGFKSCRGTCSDEAISRKHLGTAAGQMPFYSFLCSILGFICLFSTHPLTGFSTQDFQAVISSLNCWISSSFFSMAYLLDPYFPFGVPVPTTPLGEFTVIAAQVDCFL